MYPKFFLAPTAVTTKMKSHNSLNFIIITSALSSVLNAHYKTGNKPRKVRA